MLAIAIVAEVVATTALKASDGFSKPVFSSLAALGYVVAFSTLSFALKTVPLGIAYAVWSGVGVIAVTLLGMLLFKQDLDAPAYVGIGLIVAGVLTINILSSASVAHD